MQQKPHKQKPTSKKLVGEPAEAGGETRTVILWGLVTAAGGSRCEW